MLQMLLDLGGRLSGRGSRSVCPKCRGVEQFRLAGEHRSDRPQTREVIKACDLCKGKGYLTAENKSWIVQGKQLKEYRVRKGIGQTEFAHRNGGLSTERLDEMEKGYRDPSRFIEFLRSKGIEIDQA